MIENLSNYGWGLPIQASTYASKIDSSLAILHGVMILIFAVWAIYMAYCLIRYRKKDGAAGYYSHKTPLSSLIPDGVILIFEIWLIFVVGVPIFAHIKEDLPKPDNAVQVNCIAEQFTWIFHYPGPDGKFGKLNSKLVHADNPLGLDENDADAKDDIASINELHLPFGKPVLMNLSSLDVVHSFFVPEFRMKQDVVPGMLIPVWFEPNMEGQFEIGCAQLCGTGHYRMRGDVIVQSVEKHDEWLLSNVKGSQ